MTVLTKAQGNMYGFVTHCWKPLAGGCIHACSYCSTESMKKKYKKEGEVGAIEAKYSGEPRIDEKLMGNLGSENYIFVCNMNDLFASNVDGKLITRILKHCNKYPNNKYLIQSKNPARMTEFYDLIPKENFWLGTTIESDHNYATSLSKAPPIHERETAMRAHKLAGYNTLVTVEPIVKFTFDTFLERLIWMNPSMVAIGADSKHNNLEEPTKEEILWLIDNLRKNKVNVFLKHNINKIITPVVKIPTY